MKRDRRHLGAWSRVGALLLLLSAGAAAAQVEHQIVMLIDQSGSMSRMHGPRDTWEPNDRDGHRQGAVLMVFDSISDLIVRERLGNLIFRFQVVEFGSDVIVRPPVELRFDPADPTLVERARQSLEDTLRRPPPPDLGTDTQAGLEAVAKLLGRVPRERAHVLLITDGKPYVGRGEADVAATDTYRIGMEEAAHRIVRAASLEVLGLIGIEDRQQYWPEWGPFWQRASGNRAFGVRTAPEVSSRVQEIAAGWLGRTPPSAVAQPFYCPPYLEALTLTVIRSVPGQRLEVRDASGRRLDATVPGVRVVRERTYDRITIEAPQPGLWQLDGEAYEITWTPAYRQIRRQDPRSAVNVSMPTKFRYEVLSAAGKPFAELPAYPVTATLGVTEAGGGSSQIPLRHAGNGLFEAGRAFTFQDPGAARLIFTATTAVNGKDEEVFRLTEPLEIENRSLLVLDAGRTAPPRVGLRLGRGVLHPALVPRPFPTPSNGGAAELPWSEVSERPADLLQVRLVQSDGVSVARDRQEEWRPLAVTQGGKLAAELDHDVPLTSWDWWLRRPQQLFLQFRVDPGALRSEFALREVIRDASESEPTDFDRQAALPALLSDPLALPVVLREPLATYLLGCVLVLLVLAAGSWLLLRSARWSGYSFADRYRKQRIKVVFHPAGATELDGVSKDLTGRAGRTFRKAAVGINFGEDLDNPDWKPAWLKLRRCFRPWKKRVEVAVTYPVGTGKNSRKLSTTLQHGQPARPLRGMDRVEAFVQVSRKGRVVTPDS